MKKSLIVAAALAAMTFGAANVASAGVAGTSLAGISTHADTQITDQVAYRNNWRHRYWRKSHHRKHCYWR